MNPTVSYFLSLEGTSGQQVPFLMINETLGTALTGEGANITVKFQTGTGSLGAGAGTITEIGDGLYVYELAIAETPGGKLVVTHANALPQMAVVQTLPVASILSALMTQQVDGDLTFVEHLRCVQAAVAGVSSGAPTTTRVFKSYDQGLDRITATLDANNNRTGIVFDLS